jgi:sulfoxide reductase catalytic subunit YedY
MSAVLEVVRPGMLATVQDLGRTGHQREGVPVSALLEKAKARSNYVDVAFSSWDGYTERVKREEVESHLLFLALRVNGETLPAVHGFPVRLVAEDIYGSRWVKWVSEMRVD